MPYRTCANVVVFYKHKFDIKIAPKRFKTPQQFLQRIYEFITTDCNLREPLDQFRRLMD